MFRQFFGRLGIQAQVLDARNAVVVFRDETSARNLVPFQQGREIRAMEH
jgi:hypothetical protein